MKKVKYIITLTILSFFLPPSLLSSETSLQEVKEMSFGKSISVNAKVIQLSNQKQIIVSRIGGHLETYYVKPGDVVKKGDPIAKIESLELSRMTAEYLALEKKLEAAKQRLNATKKLFEKGVASRHDLNKEQIALATFSSKRETLASQLNSLDIDISSIKEPTDILIIKAHSDGLVNELLVPLHTNLNAQTPIVSLVQKSGYYAIAYISVKDALDLPKRVKGILQIGDNSFECEFLYLMPKVDEETQRAQVLFKINSANKPLLINAFAQMQISTPPYKKYLAIKKSALTMLNNEWVVFKLNSDQKNLFKHDEHGHGDHGHDEHGHDEHGHDEHGHDEHGHDEHGHDEHGHDKEFPYIVQPVQVIKSFGDYVAVKGLSKGDIYISDGVYFVKSKILKSTLDGHGH